MTCRFPLLLIAGKYRLIREIDEGGCGTVYEARHTQLSRDPKRAIKIIKPELMKREGMKERFSREVQVTGSLSQQNQHIVRIYDDFGEEPGLGHYYIMEFLKGQPVNELIQKHDGKLPIELACKLFLQLCDAMQDAHAEGIIHRDLKPENMFVIAKRRDPHFLKVIDFGIAKPIGFGDDDLALTGGALGTPTYMSPEQCTNSQITARTDIYAMGCILFELFAGFPPFSKETMGGKEPNMLEMLTFHVKQPPPSLTEHLPPDRAIPDEMAEVIIKAMAKSPDDRYPSVEALERAFLAAEEEFDASTTIRPSPFLEDDLPTGHHVEETRETALYQDTASGSSAGRPMPAVLVQETLPSTPQDERQAPATRPDQPAFSSPSPLHTTELGWDGQRRSGLWLGLAALVALCGVGIWLYATSSSDKTTPKAATEPMPAHRFIKTTKQGTPAPTRTSRAPAPRPSPRPSGQPRPAAPARAPGIVPARRTLRLRRPRPRKRFAVLVPSRIPKPRKAQGRTIKGCPRKAGLYWVRLSMSATLRKALKLRYQSRDLRIQQQSQGLCVGARRKRATLELHAPYQYHACRFRIWGRPKQVYRIHMTSEEEPNPNPVPTKPTAYCLK